MLNIQSPLSGIRSPFGRRGGFSRGGFSPAILFAGGEPGVWYDPSDLATLFQDTAGTTPVTTPGQTVALMLDKSGNDLNATQATAAARPTYGIVPETGRRNLLERTEEFNNAYWAKSGVTLLSGAESPFGGASTRQQSTGSGAAFIYKSNVAVSLSTAHTLSLFVKAGNVNFICFELDDFTTPASNTRAWFNLSTGEAETVSTNIDSTHVEDFGDGWYRVAVTFTTNATDALGTIGWFPTNANGVTSSVATGNYIDVLGAQLEVGSTATAYQRVSTAFDVTEAGVTSLGYLSFDGVDDWMVTPTITPGVDKVQVFAGVRKLSNATGMIVETSLSTGSNNGTFNLYTFTTPSNVFTSRGTVAYSAIAASTPAPSTIVLSGLGDISGDRATLRVDGTQVAQNTADQGTGNYLAYPLYIGRRAGTSMPFNGNIYSLITRFGANLDATTIGRAETYVAGKTGVTL
jgi:hypothetical protein